MNFLIKVILFLFSISAFATEVHYGARSPYALLMGDAFVARAEDDYSLFYNPAALARNKGVEFYPLNIDIAIPNALDELDRFDNFPDTPGEIADRLLGFPIYLHGEAAPTVKFGPFGLSLFANNNTNVALRNKVHPSLNMDYLYDRGFVLGFAWTKGRSGVFQRGRAKDSGHRFSVGGSVKSVQRDSVSDSFDLFGTKLLNIIEDGSFGDVDSIRKALGVTGTFAKGKGYGFDLGMEYSYVTSLSELAFGFSALDIGGITFKNIEGTKKIPSQKMLTSMGVTWRQDFYVVDYAVSLDIHPIMEPISFGRKFHLGFEFGIPFIRLMAGLNAGYLSYGLRLNVFPISITAGFYGVELGNSYKQEKGSRAIIYVSLLDFSFDA